MRYCRALLVARVRLEVRLAVECGGEGHVVEGTGDGVGALEGWHALNAVLRLVRGQLSSQLIGQDVWLDKYNNQNRMSFHSEGEQCKGHQKTFKELSGREDGFGQVGAKYLFEIEYVHCFSDQLKKPWLNLLRPQLH